MAHSLQNTIALLERTPAALDALLRGLPETWTHHNEGGETFTVVDVVGHLIYADRVDWMPRARMILEHGENKPFDPFDRRGHVEECRGGIFLSFSTSFGAGVPLVSMICVP